MMTYIHTALPCRAPRSWRPSLPVPGVLCEAVSLDRNEVKVKHSSSLMVFSLLLD